MSKQKESTDKVVALAGIEPAQPKSQDFKSCASTNSATAPENITSIDQCKYVALVHGRWVYRPYLPKRIRDQFNVDSTNRIAPPIILGKENTDEAHLISSFIKFRDYIFRDSIVTLENARESTEARKWRCDHLLKGLEASDYLADGGTHELYRYYDASEILLYVGIASDSHTRMKSHKRKKDWYPETTLITIDRFANREMLQDAEAIVINVLLPLHNIRRSSRRMRSLEQQNGESFA